MDAIITQHELDERVAFLRRFKNTLLRQRDRFQHYLDLLERGIDADADPEEALEFQVTLEEAVQREIDAFERTIAPLEVLYHAHRDSDHTDIPEIRAALRRTRDEVLRRACMNRHRLKLQIERAEGLRRPAESIGA